MWNLLISFFKKSLILLALVEIVFYIYYFRDLGIDSRSLLIAIVSLFSFCLFLHGIFTLIWMIYAWENPEEAHKHKSPTSYITPHFSFTALIPARHEETVIQDTILAVNKIDYPEELKETLILCREDDIKTINKVTETINLLKKNNIKLVTFNSHPINKPVSLNQGLNYASNEIVAIFDAEDEPHRDIYNIANTVLLNEKVDVVQSGVQLMNYQSRWFSSLNVLEYFFWFKSSLLFFNKVGQVTPLGGNTVFIKKEWLKAIGGWDEKCLTEDADIGYRLVASGARTKIIYDEEHVTKEESPSSLKGFIRQRTRWNQGFLQIFFKGDWQYLPKFKQRYFAVYSLLSSQIQGLLLLYMPFAVWLTLTQKMPIVVTLLSFLPLYILMLQITTNIVGLYIFTKAYKLKFPLFTPAKILLTFFPFQIVLTIASFRAIWKLVVRSNVWEKTLHTNEHRTLLKPDLFNQFVPN